MTCPRLEEVLTATPSAEALGHAKTCADCGPARAAWEGMGSAQWVALGTLDRARALALAELQEHPTARPWWADALALFAVNMAIATVASSLYEWRQVQHDSPIMRWGVALGLLVLIAVGAWAAIQPGVPLLRVGTLAFAAMVTMWAGLGGSGVGPSGPLLSGSGCAVVEVALATLPLAVALWATSRFAFDVTRALTGGASVGATGMLVLHLHCPNGTTAHLLAFHVAPWLLMVLATLALRRMMPSRSYAP